VTPGPPPRLADLPEAFRRDLPPLVVSGVVYASARASRLAVVNGQVMREGETLASGVTLERVFPLSAVFSFRGQRFELAP
jgi:general secretion pathway protein B